MGSGVVGKGVVGAGCGGERNDVGAIVESSNEGEREGAFVSTFSEGVVLGRDEGVSVGK